VNRRQNVTIVMVTHLLPIALNLATSIMLVGKHGIVHGPMDDVLREDRLTDLYGVPVHIDTVGGRRTLAVGQGDGGA
jgi:ABC-type cobalamin/Fe3+-siderophores transport system ATPase subunit